MGDTPDTQIPISEPGQADGAVQPKTAGTEVVPVPIEGIGEADVDAATVVAMTEDVDVLTQLVRLEAPVDDEILRDPVAAEFLERIETAKRIEVFQVADALAVKYALANFVTKLPEKYRKAGAEVIENYNFANVPEGMIEAFLNLSHAKEQISRRLIMYMLYVSSDGKQESVGRGFSDLEVAELFYGAQIGDAADEIFMEWFGTEHKMADPDERKRKGFTSRWHFVMEDRDNIAPPGTEPSYVEVPYQKIWPKEYELICSALSGLIDDIQVMIDKDDGNEKLEAKLRYYSVLREAFQTEDPRQAEVAWRKVDEAFVTQDHDLSVVHPMEYGYERNSTGITIDYGVRMRLPDHPLNAAIDRRQALILKMLPGILDGKEEALKGLNVVRNMMMAAFYFAIRSGRELKFKMAGQNVPNDDEVRHSTGVVAYLNPSSMVSRLKEAADLFKAIFPQELHAMLDEIDPDEVNADVIVHEMGHNIGNRDGFKENPEGVQALEEWKATATTFVLQSLQLAENPDAISEKTLRGTFAGRVGQFVRYANLRDKAPAYFKHDLFFMKTAQECGLIMSGDEEGQWKFDLSREKLIAFADRVKEQWLNLQDIYKEKDQGALNRLAQENLVMTPFTECVVSAVDRLKAAKAYLTLSI